MLCSRTRYVSTWFASYLGSFATLFFLSCLTAVLWPQNFHLSRMKNQEGHWGYCSCRWVERTTVTEEPATYNIPPGTTKVPGTPYNPELNCSDNSNLTILNSIVRTIPIYRVCTTNGPDIPRNSLRFQNWLSGQIQYVRWKSLKPIARTTPNINCPDSSSWWTVSHINCLDN